MDKCQTLPFDLRRLNRYFRKVTQLKLWFILTNLKKKIDFYGILNTIYCIIFKEYMNLFVDNQRYKISYSFPRNYNFLYKLLFDTYLNLESSKKMPNLEEEFINNFFPIFTNELATSFSRSKKYWNCLDKDFRIFVETKTKTKNWEKSNFSLPFIFIRTHFDLIYFFSSYEFF